MLFWLFVIGLLVGIGLLFLGCNETYSKNKVIDKIFDFLFYHESIGWWVVIISSICVVISLLVMAYNYIGADAGVERNKERYKTLIYKLETEEARDEFGLLNKEIIDEIQEWNEDVVYYKNIQDNFWTGVYYPNVFDQFETIELK